MSRARLLLLLLATAAAGATVYASLSGGLFSSLGLRTVARAEDARTAAFASLSRAPHDAVRWLRLGEEAHREGDLVLARAAFRAAQEIAPDDGEPHARLGFLLYEEGQDEAALEQLRLARAKGADVALLDFTVSMMRAHVDLAGPFPRFSEQTPPPESDDARGATRAAERDRPTPEERAPEPANEPGPLASAEPPAPQPSDALAPGADDDLRDDDDDDDEPDEGPTLAAPSPQGACELFLERRGETGIFVIDALVNGTPARLIVDTGASLTVLSRDFLADSGLRLVEDGVLTARTAGGPQRFATAAVESVEVGERVARDIRVAICDDCGMPGSDGLLGLDVQEPLGMSLFPGRGTVRFADCFD